jgi:hypothetical protein
MPRRIWQALAGFDARFTTRGGGLVNLDLYKRACEYPGTRHVVLLGEGTFHQFHGGATTGGEDVEAREKLIETIKAEYQRLRGGTYKSPETDPIFLGELPREAQKFVHLSSTSILERLNNAIQTTDEVAAALEN